MVDEIETSGAFFLLLQQLQETTTALILPRHWRSQFDPVGLARLDPLAHSEPGPRERPLESVVEGNIGVRRRAPREIPRRRRLL